MSREDSLRGQRVIYKKGWVAPHWPVECGGTGWTITKRYIWNEENARAETTPLLPFGLSMVGPVIYTFGNEEQKKRFLPGILSGDDWWCQGYSEPGSGSDLASLRTKAVREGDHYIVNGSKTWTTLAQHADWMFCLVRTDPDANHQEGLLLLLFLLQPPSISVPLIRTLDGSHASHHALLAVLTTPAEHPHA